MSVLLTAQSRKKPPPLCRGPCRIVKSHGHRCFDLAVDIPEIGRQAGRTCIEACSDAAEQQVGLSCFVQLSGFGKVWFVFGFWCFWPRVLGILGFRLRDFLILRFVAVFGLGIFRFWGLASGFARTEECGGQCISLLEAWQTRVLLRPYGKSGIAGTSKVSHTKFAQISGMPFCFIPIEHLAENLVGSCFGADLGAEWGMFRV